MTSSLSGPVELGSPRPSAFPVAGTEARGAAGGSGNAAARQQRPGPRTAMRWLALAQFCLQSFMNGVQWILLSNLTTQATAFFGMSNTQLDWLSTSFYVVYLATTAVGIAWFDVHGVRASLKVASLLNLVGGLLKIVAALWVRNFPMLLLSSVVAGTAQSFFLPVPAALSCVWFADDERTLATTIAATFNPLGGAAGLLLAPLFVNATHNDARAFVTLFVAVTLLNVVDTVLVFCVIPDTPEHPPSESARVRRVVTGRQSDIAFGDRVRRIIDEAAPFLKQPRVLALLVGCGAAAGNLWSFSTLLAQLMQPFGVSQAGVGYIGGANVALSIPVCVAVARYADVHRVYKPPLLVALGFIVSLTGLLALLLVVLPDYAVYSCYVVGTLLGGPQNVVLPIAFEALAETTFPMNENVCGALVLSFAEVFAIVLMNVFGSTLSAPGDQKASATKVWIAMVGINVLAFVIVALARVELKRKQQTEDPTVVSNNEQSENPEKMPLLLGSPSRQAADVHP